MKPDTTDEVIHSLDDKDLKQRVLDAFVTIENNNLTRWKAILDRVLYSKDVEAIDQTLQDIELMTSESDLDSIPLAAA